MSIPEKGFIDEYNIRLADFVNKIDSKEDKEINKLKAGDKETIKKVKQLVNDLGYQGKADEKTMKDLLKLRSFVLGQEKELGADKPEKSFFKKLFSKDETPEKIELFKSLRKTIGATFAQIQSRHYQGDWDRKAPSESLAKSQGIADGASITEAQLNDLRQKASKMSKAINGEMAKIKEQQDALDNIRRKETPEEKIVRVSKEIESAADIKQLKKVIDNLGEKEGVSKELKEEVFSKEEFKSPVEFMKFKDNLHEKVAKAIAGG